MRDTGEEPRSFLIAIPREKCESPDACMRVVPNRYMGQRMDVDGMHVWTHIEARGWAE